MSRASLAVTAVPRLAHVCPQGLAIDLKGLATCLELLPKNLLLETDAFSSDGEGSAAGGWSTDDELPDLPPQWAATQQPEAVPAEAMAPPPVQAAVAAAAEAAGDAGVADLLSELLGEGSPARRAAAPQQTPQRTPAAMAPTAAARGMPAAPGQPPAAMAQRPAAAGAAARARPPQSQQPPQAADADDVELDALLGLVPGKPPSAGGGAAPRPPAPAAPVTQAAAGQSLEDWLDGL